MLSFFGTFKCCEKTALAGLRLPRSCCLRFAFICLWTNRLETEAPAMLKIGEQGAGGEDKTSLNHNGQHGHGYNVSAG